MRQFFTPKKINLLILSVILIITAWIYLPCLSSELVDWDDQFQISNNFDIRSLSFASIQNIFSTFYAGMYQPLATLSFALEYKLWHAFPLFLHLDNLLLHLLSVVLVYILTKKIFRQSLVALISSALFALHPIQVETVAWVSARSNLLFAVFSLATLIAYTSYCQKTKLQNYLATLGLFLLALLSKAPAVVLPVVMLVLDYYYHRPNSKKLLWEKIPFLGLSLLFGWITIKGRIFDSIVPVFNYTWWDRLTFVTYSPLDYLQKILLPYNLSPFYALPVKTNNYLPIIFYLSLLLGLVLLWLMFKYRQKRSLVLGLSWFLLLVLPSIQITTFSTTLTADRYVYLASVGIFWLISLGLWLVWERFKNLRLIFSLAIFMIFFMLAIQTKLQAGVWENSLMLWTTIVKDNPTSANAYTNLGNAKTKTNDLTGAREAYDQALALNKYDPYIYNNLGTLLEDKLAQHAEAINYYNQAIKLNPQEGLFYYNRGCALVKLNRLEEALNDYQIAVQLASGEKFYNYSYLNSLASLAYRLNYFLLAERNYDQIIQLNPQLADPYWWRGLAKIKLNDQTGGCQDLRLAEKLGYQDNDNNLAKFCK